MITKLYRSPLGMIALAADARGLTGLWFEGQAHYGATLDGEGVPNGLGSASAVLDYTWAWLDTFFAGRAPAYTPPLHLIGTPFQLEVWSVLQGVPRGSTVTYGWVSDEICRRRLAAGDERSTSPRAVGGAVGRNPVSIIVPCHRVVGANGALTGYAGGLDRKKWLLDVEKRFCNDAGARL